MFSSLKDLGGQSTHKRRGGNHQSLERVDRKVASGGHNIPEDVLRCRILEPSTEMVLRLIVPC